jgi:hypothetical protein
MQENSNPKSRLSLAEAVRGAQIAMADRGDFASDAREADLARIELLAQDLQPVFDDVPEDDQQWDFAISKGQQPRLWIDATSHVVIARDRRTYRFLRDTRAGRIVVAEAVDIRAMADAVTNYIAERIVERRYLMEGRRSALVDARSVKEAREAPGAPVAVTVPAGSARQRSRLSAFFTALFWFLIGASAGAAALVLLFRERFASLAGLVQ